MIPILEGPALNFLMHESENVVWPNHCPVSGPQLSWEHSCTECRLLLRSAVCVLGVSKWQPSWCLYSVVQASVWGRAAVLAAFLDCTCLDALKDRTGLPRGTDSSTGVLGKLVRLFPVGAGVGGEHSGVGYILIETQKEISGDASPSYLVSVCVSQA